MLVLQPKFLSKKEREALALQRRQEAVTGQKSRCALQTVGAVVAGAGCLLLIPLLLARLHSCKQLCQGAAG